MLTRKNPSISTNDNAFEMGSEEAKMDLSDPDFMVAFILADYFDSPKDDAKYV